MKDSTDITILLDRSGSMGAIRTETIGGYNNFLAEQKALPDECRLALVQFDDAYEPNYADVLVRDAPPLTEETYVPRGWTALYDALGKSIHDTGARLAAKPEAERPRRVLFVVITDGQENRSREYTRERVFELIGRQREHYSWEFVFLAANQDAFAEAAKMNIHAAGNFDATKQGIGDMYTNASKNLRSYRIAGSIARDWSTDKDSGK